MGKKNPALKKRQTYKLKLTQLELLHLRNLFGVLLPAGMGQTLSQALSHKTDSALIEATLWQKVSRALDKAKIPVDDDAPDYVIVPSGTPTLDVFEISTGETEEEEDDTPQAGLLLEGDEEEEDRE